MNKINLDNDLDLKLIDQLHAATLQISNFCFEIKKFCISILFTAITIIISITNKKLDHFIFITGFVIPFIFWIADSTGYYYQNKLRLKMNEVRRRILDRQQEKIIVSNFYVNNIESKQAIKLLNSFFNNSMWLYYLLFFMDIILWVSFLNGYIK